MEASPRTVTMLAAGAAMLLVLFVGAGDAGTIVEPPPRAALNVPPAQVSPEPAREPVVLAPEYLSFTQMAGLWISKLPKRQAWSEAAPRVEELAIPRRGNEPPQPALFYHSGSAHKKPLLIVLHSWSADYLQYDGIPYATFAERNDWIFLHPDYRGRFGSRDATASDKAVDDVLEAIAYAKRVAPVDERRVYLAGFSGGAMVTLLMVGRYPGLFTAALAWVPVYDLNDWYTSVSESRFNYARQYQSDIIVSCGGRPDRDARAATECSKRSPSSELHGARGKPVQVLVGAGTRDHFVPPSHAIRAFNCLAAPSDAINEPLYRSLDRNRALPDALGEPVERDRLFDDAGLPLVLRRTSNNATLVLFDGGHNVVYNAGLEWLSQQRH